MAVKNKTIWRRNKDDCNSTQRRTDAHKLTHAIDVRHTHEAANKHK